MRPIRVRIKFDEETLNKLFNEVYNESHNIKAKIVRLFNKWEVRVKEGGEIAAIGDQIVKLLAAETKNQDQKLTLLKMLADVIYVNNNSNNSKAPTKKESNVPEQVEVKQDVSKERKNELLRLAKEYSEKK